MRKSATACENIAPKWPMTNQTHDKQPYHVNTPRPHRVFTAVELGKVAISHIQVVWILRVEMAKGHRD
jgi:hypothetical protein